MLMVHLAAVVLLLALSALWSCTETVYTSVSKVWLRERAAEGDPRAARACRMLADADRFLGTVLLGNNLVNVGYVAVFRLLVSAWLAEAAGLGGILERLHCGGDLLTTLVSTPVVLVFGEILPKAVGRAYSEPLSLRLAEAVHRAQGLLRPLVSGIVWISGRLVRSLDGRGPAPAGSGGAPGAAGGVTRDDLRALAEMMAEQGLVAREVGGMLQMVLDLEKKTVGSVMTPLAEVRSVPLAATVAEVERLTIRSGFTRFPVFSERVDDIVGVVSLRQMQREQRRLGIPDREFAARGIADFVDRGVLFVPETRSIGGLLEDLRHQPVPLAIVVDEYGGMTGVATVEDLAAQVVGNIRDDRARPAPGAVRIDARTFECDGKLDVRDLEAWLGLKVERDGFETAAGLALKITGRIPRAGESFDYRGFRITVLEAPGHRIGRLRFSKEHQRKEDR